MHDAIPSRILNGWLRLEEDLFHLQVLSYLPPQIPISQFQKLEVDYQLIIKNIIPKIANPSQIATILKFFELIFPFLYSSWHK